MLYPMLVNGVPVAFEQTEDAFKRISEYRIIVAFVENTGCSFAVRRRSGCYAGGLMKKDPDFGEMAGLAEPMLKAFPEIIESTTKVEIGLNFVK